MTAILLPYVAGLVTLLNPCVLPLLPIIVGAALGQSVYGPAALAAGLVSSFAVLGFALLTIGFSIGIEQETIRFVAALVLVLAGTLIALPRAHAVFASVTAPFVQGGNQLLGRVSGRGLAGQFTIGSLLGVVWVPCVGPTLGVAIASASQGKNLASAFLAFLVFGLGVATSLMGFAYGSRRALTARKATFQSLERWSRPILGWALVVVGALAITGLDRAVEAALVAAMPPWLLQLTVGL